MRKKLKNEEVISDKTYENEELKREASKEIFVPIKVVKRGMAKSHVFRAPQDPGINEPLRRAIVKAYKWENEISTCGSDGFPERHKVSKRYVQQILRLNCLSPRIKKAIMDGTFPRHILLQDLKYSNLALLWREQERKFFGDDFTNESRAKEDERSPKCL